MRYLESTAKAILPYGKSLCTMVTLTTLLVTCIEAPELTAVKLTWNHDVNSGIVSWRIWMVNEASVIPACRLMIPLTGWIWSPSLLINGLDALQVTCKIHRVIFFYFDEDSFLIFFIRSNLERFSGTRRDLNPFDTLSDKTIPDKTDELGPRLVVYSQ